MTIATTRPDTEDLPAGGVVHLLGPQASVPGWLVRVGDEVYLRSRASGASVDARGRGRVRVDGVDHPVVLSEVAPEMHDVLDDAYRATYGRCRPEQVADMTSDAAAASTVRLRRRRPTVVERVADTVAAWQERTAARQRPARGVRGSAAPCPCGS